MVLSWHATCRLYVRRAAQVNRQAAPAGGVLFLLGPVVDVTSLKFEPPPQQQHHLKKHNNDDYTSIGIFILDVVVIVNKLPDPIEVTQLTLHKNHTIFFEFVCVTVTKNFLLLLHKSAVIEQKIFFFFRKNTSKSAS